MKKTKRWIVTIYTPGGLAFRRVELHAMTAQVAIDKCKRIVYKLGKLAHFYSYVPVEVEQ